MISRHFGTRWRGARKNGADVALSLKIDFLEAVRGAKKRVRVRTGRTVDVTIPAGVEDGEIIRLKGQGAPGAGGGRAGDALVSVAVAPHRDFARTGIDIHAELAITLPKALLGAKIKIPTIDGSVALSVPKGSNTGSTLRLKNKGIAGPGARARRPLRQAQGRAAAQGRPRPRTAGRRLGGAASLHRTRRTEIGLGARDAQLRRHLLASRIGVGYPNLPWSRPESWMTTLTSLLAGKRGLIMGVANERSIAWGIARTLAAHGADLAFTYQGDALGKRVAPLAASVDSKLVMECDVTEPASTDAAFAEIERAWGGLDFLVHAIAYSDRDQLKGRFIDVTAENFTQSLEVSCYSFIAVCQRAERLMREGGGILTMTYYGAEKVIPHYNVMGVAKAALEATVRYLSVDLGKRGVRVNAISAGPIKTLAASGIGDFRYILKWNEYNSPLRRTVTIDDVGGAALYLLSDLGRSVTGEVHHVDCGYHVVGMKSVDAPDIATVESTS